MSTNPVSFRIAFESQIAKLPPEHQTVIRTQMNAITDLQGAIPALKSQIDSLKTSATGSSTTSGTTATITENVTTINNTIDGGGVNDQSGVTAYINSQMDNGKLVILADTAAVAVTLNNSVTTPYWVFFINQGSGLVTLTPQQGTINGAASEELTDSVFALVFFDSINYWSCTTSIVPQSFSAITHQFLTAYSAATGLFSSAQPSIADVSGLSSALGLLAPLSSPSLTGTPTTPTAAPGTNTTQIASTAFVESATAPLAPIASPTFTGTVTQASPSVLTAATTATSATAGAASALPATPTIYLEISINGTVYKFPGYSV